MLKRTREMSLASTVPTDSLDSKSSVEDVEYIQGAATSRPTTRRRANNGRSVVSSSISAPPASLSADIEAPSPSTMQADDPKSTRKLQRKERNRISAQHSRDRKKNESQELRGRLEEAETRMLALQADNERLREENGRCKLELEKSASLQIELVSLKERFEILERLLLAGSSQQSSSLPPSTSTSHVATSTSAIPSLSQSPISAPVQADSRIGSEAHALAVPFDDELGQSQRNFGDRGSEEQPAEYKQQQEWCSGEYSEQISTIDYNSFDDLLQPISSTLPASYNESTYTTFEDLFTGSSSGLSSDESLVSTGQAAVSLPTTAQTTSSSATYSNATNSASTGPSQAYHDDDDRFFVKQQEELNNIALFNTSISQSASAPADYLSSYLAQGNQGYDASLNTTNPFFFGIPLDIMMNSNTFTSGISV